MDALRSSSYVEKWYEGNSTFSQPAPGERVHKRVLRKSDALYLRKNFPETTQSSLKECRNLLHITATTSFSGLTFNHYLTNFALKSIVASVKQRSLSCDPTRRSLNSNLQTCFPIPASVSRIRCCVARWIACFLQPGESDQQYTLLSSAFD